MKRWNGWGDESIVYPLSSSAIQYLTKHLGGGRVLADSSLDSVLRTIPASNLPPHPLLQVEPLDRLQHSRGQSLPDWIALRSGRIETFPDAVAYPTSNDDIRKLFNYARKVGCHLIPYGGGTSVVGHINPLSDYAPYLTIDLSRLTELIDYNHSNRLAVFQAGIKGPDLESQLNKLGYTLGHFPQSFEQSTLGGWIATRSSGQQSYYYGRIEQLFCGGHLETPSGPLEIPIQPASAAGPDLRHFVLGSEGRYGIITQASVRIQPIPEQEKFYGIFFPNWSSGVDALREIAQERVPASMLRLSNPMETETTLVLSGKENTVKWAKRALNFLGFGPERCLLVFGITSSNMDSIRIKNQLKEITGKHGGSLEIQQIGRLWRKTRFLTPYLRNSLWELGYAIDTLETSLPWSIIEECTSNLISSLTKELENSNEKVLAFDHLSHIYPDGASIYVTYIFRRSEDPDRALEHWKALKKTASQVIIHHKGTISHQHGVGSDHIDYLVHEKGQIGLEMLGAVQKYLDPDGLLNPGKLLS